MNKNNPWTGMLARWLLLGLAAAVLTGCGFHLRGVVKLPAGMERVYVDGPEASPVVRELKLRLRSSGSKVVASTDDATAVLHVSSVEEQSRVLSVTIGGQSRESELVSIVHFSVTAADGKPLRGDERVVVARDYQYDENDLLGAANEQELMRKEMQRDLAQAILRRLEYTAQP